MVEFAYKAIDPSGKRVSGFYEANGHEDLEFRLSKQGFHLVSAKSSRQGLALFSRKKVDRQGLIVLFIYLEQMASAGIPLFDSLDEMRNSEESVAMRNLLGCLIDDISSGQSFSGAMSEHLDIFNQLMINLVKSGEQTGDMGRIFAEIRDILTWQDTIIRKTKKLLTYPLFVGTMIFGVICFLMIYLVPQLVSFIISMDQEIPLVTVVLIRVSDIFVNYWPAILSSPILIFLFARQVLQNNARARYLFDRYKLKIPLFGEAIRKIDLSRFCKSFALLYEAGVSVLDCLQVSSESIANVYIGQELEEIKDTISAGSSLHGAFSTSQIFPPLVLRMLHVGEKTGELGASLTRISDFYSRDVTELIEKIQTMIEPAMTIVMGLLLGWIMVAVLGPIYDIISTIQF